MKLKKQWSLNWLNEKKSKRLGHVDGVTYRRPAGLRRCPNGQFVCTVDRFRGIHGKQRKKVRRLQRSEAMNRFNVV